MRKTKIICTMGPATADDNVLRELMLAGMDVARINFSHGTHEEAKVIMDRIKRVRAELDMPVVIHCREAVEDTMELLRRYRPRGVMHCFSGSAEMAREILSLGMYIGIGGVLTFKNAKKLPEIAAALPSDRFLLETDAPYLAPVPYRSKINTSALILLVAEKLAELRNTDCESILKESRNNAEKLFGI